MSKKSDSSLQPDETRYRFVKTIDATEVSDISDRDRFFSRLAPGARLKFVREPENPHDANAIRIDDSFCLGNKLGYVPRADAEKWAPVMDSGTFYTGWLKSLNRSRGKILVDVYERLKLPISGITHIGFSEWGYTGPTITVEISIPERSFVYKCREDMPPEERMSSERFIKEQRKKGVSFEVALQAFFRFAEEQEQEQEQEPREKMGKLVLPFPEEQWNDFAVPALQAINFPAWGDEYVDPYICDGTQWGMHIRRGENVRKIHGSNDFPEEYGVFRKFISDCLKLNQEKGLGTFTTRIQAKKHF